MTLSRSTWKRLQHRQGLPEGERKICVKCGALMVFEQKDEATVVHHTLPWCNHFTRFIELLGPDFHVLSETPERDVAEALSELK